jgi:hypothetical protein
MLDYYGFDESAPRAHLHGSCTRCGTTMESDGFPDTWCADCQEETAERFPRPPRTGAFARACPACQSLDLDAVTWWFFGDVYESTAVDGIITTRGTAMPAEPCLQGTSIGCTGCGWVGPQACLVWQPMA